MDGKGKRLALAVCLGILAWMPTKLVGQLPIQPNFPPTLAQAIDVSASRSSDSDTESAGPTGKRQLRSAAQVRSPLRSDAQSPPVAPSRKPLNQASKSSVQVQPTKPQASIHSGVSKMPTLGAPDSVSRVEVPGRDNLTGTAKASQVSNPTPVEPESGRVKQRPVSVLAPKPLNPEISTLHSNLELMMISAQRFAASQPIDVRLDVINRGTTESGPLKVVLAIPDQLTINQFDRDAWLDGNRRTITFQLDTIPGRHKQSIRIVANTYVSGHHAIRGSIVRDGKALDFDKHHLLVEPD